MEGKLSSKSPSPMKQKMSGKRSGVESMAISAAGLASRLSRKPTEISPVDPEQAEPMLHDNEVITGNQYLPCPACQLQGD